MSMTALGVILARAGSKGLPDKCVRPLLGRAVIDYTFDHALSSGLLTDVVFTTDSAAAAARARERGIEVIERPAELAIDTATVDSAVRHAVEVWEARHYQEVDFVVLLYGNIPVRPSGLIDRAISHLQDSGADSVRSVARVTKQHPDWVHRLDGDRMAQFRKNSIYRRQDLEPLYYHDGAVAAVTRSALFGALQTPTDFQSFLGVDRRAIICEPEDAVDIDDPIDLAMAQAILSTQSQTTITRDDREKASCDVQIGDRPIGPDKDVFVIAEAGVNHNGDVDTAIRMIDAARGVGADAIKFQVFRAGELTSVHAATAEYQNRATSHSNQKEMLADLELDDAAFMRIKESCDERGIMFLATPFGVRDVPRLMKLGVPAIKIASTDLNHTELIQAAAATGLPLIVSTGAATSLEIETSVSLLKSSGAAQRLILMHCISSYPTPLQALNLRVIETLQKQHGLPVGFSDHSLEVECGAWAVMAGACVIEKHFTLDKDMTGPDHAMSLSPTELDQYVTAIRRAQAARGSGNPGFGPIEREVRYAARRSIVADRPIPKGTLITRPMLALKRPGTGISPDLIESVIGKTAGQDIPSDAILSWSMMR